VRRSSSSGTFCPRGLQWVQALSAVGCATDTSFRPGGLDGSRSK
jgi:hypothetical protein